MAVQIEVSTMVETIPNPAPARTFAAGWAPAALTDRGAAMCRLIDFEDAFVALGVADRAYFAYRLSELLVEACDAETRLR